MATIRASTPRRPRSFLPPPSASATPRSPTPKKELITTGAEVFSQPLSVAFFNSADRDVQNGINPLLRSLGVDFSQATDAYAVGALRNLLVAGLVGGAVDKIDLIAIDIQRQRDVGLGTLNQTRKALGMEPYTSYAELTSDARLQNSLKIVYGQNGIDNVDLFIGGLAENHAQGAIVGPTFQAIIADQFEALRAGDRLFWLNEGFDQATSWMIAHTTLAKLLQRNASTPNLQANVFIQADLPAPHRWHHDAAPSIINGSGRAESLYPRRNVKLSPRCAPCRLRQVDGYNRTTTTLLYSNRQVFILY